MNVVNAGSRYQIYGDDVRTYKRLPIASYEVAFNPMSGFSLFLRPDLVVNEEKIYGNHEARVDKVLRSFSLTNRNFGVILSGQKGIGKSLFARMLAAKSLERDLPVILVSNAAPGIADFLSSIEQEVVVIFDEFEKNFGGDEGESQEQLLSLFDGLDNGKKLFVITCNEVHRLNSYLLNRPGRFHYHFTISNPSDDEVRAYLRDKLKVEYHHVIERVVQFANTVNVTYDYLRAIAFELNQGYELGEVLSDLNITRTSDVYFDIEVVMNNEMVFTRNRYNVNLYANRELGIRAYGKTGTSVVVDFNPKDISFKEGKLALSGEDVELDFDADDFLGFTKEEYAALKATLKVDHVIFTRCDYSNDTKIRLMV